MSPQGVEYDWVDMTWRIRGGTVALERPVIVGILNVTPDSFSDGGTYRDPATAAARAREMVGEGADLIDVGGESTRPQGATPVSEEEELARVIPVVRAVRDALPDTPISIDTVKASVARAAIEAGAAVVNDVSGFRLDAAMPRVCADAGVGVILMHSRGTVADMATYARAEYGSDVTGTVIAELTTHLARARDAGVHRDAIVLDPGIGFSKRSDQSLQLLAHLPRLVTLGYPVLVGVSRKRFIGEITGVQIPTERVDGTVGATVAALMLGARLFRVHDIAANRRALDVAWEITRRGLR
jgi:dihydropteroate synthase